MRTGFTAAPDDGTLDAACTAKISSPPDVTATAAQIAARLDRHKCPVSRLKPSSTYHRRSAACTCLILSGSGEQPQPESITETGSEVSAGRAT